MRTGNFAAGALLACLLLASAWRLPVGASVGADVAVLAAPTGELDVRPPGEVLTTTGLAPGGGAVTGALRVRNQTGSELGVHVELVGRSQQLNRKLAYRVTDGGAAVAEGTVGVPADFPRPLSLRPGELRTLRLTVWVPAGATDVDGRTDTLDTTFDVVASEHVS